MFAKVPEIRLRRKLISYQLLSRQREQHLPAVGCGQEPGNPVYGWAEVVPVSLLCGSSVQSHPHPKRLALLPFGRMEPTLSLQGGLQCIRGGWKDGTEGVTDRLEDVATIPLYGRPE
jgi:hypothetical protein